MRLRLRSERLLLGFRGLGLLRAWPFDDPVRADAQLSEMREILLASDGAPDLEIDAMEMADAYASWSATYDDAVNALIAAEQPAVRDLAAGIPPGRALDVAAGTGRLALLLRELGHRVIAMSSSSAMLDQARRSGGFRTLARADIRRLPVRDGSVDLVTCGLALTHVANLDAPLAELARVVRPGGHVLVSDIHPVAVATGAHAFFRAEDGSRGVTRNEVHWAGAYVEAARRAGLVVERLVEPPFDRAFLDEMSDERVRQGAELGLLGFPFAIVWRFLRPGE
jgi:ubiquinone/menaquinone biosynthesis C-methylase UbiE